jgi:hypothetical protein
MLPIALEGRDPEKEERQRKEERGGSTVRATETSEGLFSPPRGRSP